MTSVAGPPRRSGSTTRRAVWQARTSVALWSCLIVSVGLVVEAANTSKSPLASRSLSLSHSLSLSTLFWPRNDPSRTVLDDVPAPPKGAWPPIFGPSLLWPNGRMDQDATWYGGWPQPRRHCLTRGPSSPSQNGGHNTWAIFGPCLLWPNG